MSHILDALRQAEDERRLGRPPGRSAIASPLRSARRQRSNRVIWLVIALALAGLATAAWLGRPYFEPAPSLNTPAPESTQSAAEQAEAPLPTSVRPSREEASTPKTEQQASTPTPSRPTAAAPTPPKQEMPRAQLAEAQSIDSLDALFGSHEAEPQASATSQGSSASTQPLNPTDIFKESEAPAPDRDGGASTSGNEIAEEVAGPTPRPSALSELPKASKVGMPDITIDVHVYNEDPDRRFVLINSRRRAEGDTLDNGAVIERITPDGLILDWKGMRVAAPLSR